MRIAQISDFHFTRLTWNPFRLLSKRILGHINWLLKRKNIFIEEPLYALLPLFEELGVDLVLIGGDISTTSLLEEFAKGKEFIQQIPSPWIAIPGNHDHYTYRSYRQKHFYRYFTNNPATLSSLKESGIEAHQIGKWWIIALDTALATNPYSSQGLFSEKLENSLNEMLQRLPKEAPILLLNHFPFFQNDIPRHSLKRGEALQKILERDRRIRLYLHGHTHRQIVADLQVSRLPIVLDGGCAAHASEGSWNLIDLKEDGCSITPYRWTGTWKPKQTANFPWKR